MYLFGTDSCFFADICEIDQFPVLLGNFGEAGLNTKRPSGSEGASVTFDLTSELFIAFSLLY